MRTPDGPTARDVTLTLRITKSQLAAIDRQRRTLSRSEYLRRLVMADTLARPKPKRVVQLKKPEED